MFVLTRLEALPRSTLVINWFVLMALLGAPRLAYRLFKDRGLDHVLERAKRQSVPVLLISAKDGADTFIREMMRDPRAVYRVVGVLADTPSRVGRDICRVPVLGTIDSLEAVVARLDRRGKRPQKLIITAHNLPGRAGAPPARPRRRAGDPAGAPAAAHRFRATSGTSTRRCPSTRNRADRARRSAGPAAGGA